MAGRSKNAGRRLLVLKHDRWWFRREIPEAARKALGKGRFWMVNLRTADLRTAQRLRDELERETAETFAAIRSGESVSASGLSAREQGILYREAIAAAAEVDPGESDQLGPLDVATSAAEAAAESFRDEGERAAFMDALHGYEPVDTHVEAYLGTAKIAPKTRNERRGLIGRFARWATAQKPALTLDRIDRKRAGRYVSEVIDKLDHPATQTKHLTALRSYWRYLAARGLIDLPPGTSLKVGWPWNDQQLEDRSKRVERGGRGQEERPFTEAEVKTLLYAPYPAGVRPEYEAQIRDALRVSLLSGLRMAEVLTLWVEEVRDGPEGAGLVFDIQQGKTDAAARPVPVHPDLTEIVQRRLRDAKGNDKPGKAWLFDELAAERDPGDTFGKRFARFRKKLGVDDVRPGHRRSLVNFHSARRWFVTEARHAGQPKETIADVVGHVPDKKDVTFGVYTKGASPAQMRACIEAVKLPAAAPKKG